MDLNYEHLAAETFIADRFDEEDFSWRFDLDLYNKEQEQGYHWFNPWVFPREMLGAYHYGTALANQPLEFTEDSY